MSEIGSDYAEEHQGKEPSQEFTFMSKMNSLAWVSCFFLQSKLAEVSALVEATLLLEPVATLLSWHYFIHILSKYFFQNPVWIDRRKPFLAESHFLSQSMCPVS